MILYLLFYSAKAADGRVAAVVVRYECLRGVLKDEKRWELGCAQFYEDLLFNWIRFWIMLRILIWFVWDYNFTISMAWNINWKRKRYSFLCINNSSRFCLKRKSFKWTSRWWSRLSKINIKRFKRLWNYL